MACPAVLVWWIITFSKQLTPSVKSYSSEGGFYAWASSNVAISWLDIVAWGRGRLDQPIHTLPAHKDTLCTSAWFKLPPPEEEKSGLVWIATPQRGGQSRGGQGRKTWEVHFTNSGFELTLCLKIIRIIFNSKGNILIALKIQIFYLVYRGRHWLVQLKLWTTTTSPFLFYQLCLIFLIFWEDVKIRFL